MLQTSNIFDRDCDWNDFFSQQNIFFTFLKVHLRMTLLHYAVIFHGFSVLFSPLFLCKILFVGLTHWS